MRTPRRDVIGGAYAEVPLKVNDHALDATRCAPHTALGRASPAQAAWDAWLLMRERARDRERERDAAAAAARAGETGER